MADEVNALVEELGVADVSHIGTQNYAASETENARVAAQVVPKQTNPRYLVLEQVLPPVTEFDQKPEEKAKAEAYLAAIQDISAIEAANAKAKADQLAREAAQQALAEPPAA